MGMVKEKTAQWMHSQKFWQFVRFVVTGCLSSAVHIGIYYLLMLWTSENVAYITGYVVSSVGNFFFTSYFTFRTKPTWKRFVGFAGSHAVNFGLHVVLFNLFLWMGVNALVIPYLVIGIAMMVQFTILRFVFTHKGNQ